MKPDEMKRYLGIYVAASNGLGDAVVILKRLESNTLDADKKREIVLQRREVEDEITKNDQEFLAVVNEGQEMKAPTQDQVNSVVSKAVKLAVLTQKATTLSAVLKLSNRIIAEYGTLRG